MFLPLLQIALLSCLDFMSLALSERQCLAIAGPNWQGGGVGKDKTAEGFGSPFIDLIGMNLEPS